MLRIAFYIIIFLACQTAQAQEKLVRIATLEFSPYVSEFLPGNGWAWEVAARAFEEEGYKAELNILPWARAVKQVQSGRMDALYMANKNPEREVWASFTDPIGDEISVLFKRRDRSIDFDDFSSLKKYQILALNGAHVGEALKKHGINVLPVSDYQFGVKQIFYYRADAFVADKYVLTYFLQSRMPLKFLHQIDFIEKPVDRSQLHLAVSHKTPNYQEITDSFNRGLAKIRNSGAYNKILQRYGF